MKKLIIIMALAPFAANAATMCKNNDAIWYFLYANDIDISSRFTGTASGSSWTVTNSSNSSQVFSGTIHCSASNTSTSSSGGYCWCKMTSPIVGNGVFLSNFGSASDCSSNCASSCANCVSNGTNSACSRSALMAS
jgi:hypothetical protein